MISHWLDGFNFTMEYFRFLLLKHSLQLMGICMRKLCSYWGKKKQQQMLNCQYHMNLNIWCPCQERLSLNTFVGCSCGWILKRFLVRYSWDLWDQWAMNSQSSVTSICSHVICCESECDSNILFLFVWVKTTVASIWQTFISIIGMD